MIGFWCSVGSPVVLLMGLMVPGHFLVEASVVMLLLGLGVSFVGTVMGNTSPGPARLAVAGLVIAVCISPFLLFIAAWN